MNKIRTKTTAALILAGLIPVIILIALSLADTSGRIRTEKLESRAELCQEIGSQVERVVEHAVGYLGLLSTSPVLINESVSEGERQGELARARQVLSAEVTLLDEDGYIIGSSSPLSTLVKESSPWFFRARDTRTPCVSSAIKPPYDNRLYISVYLPVSPGSGVATAVIKATLPFDQINQVLSNVSTGDSGELVLLDSNNNRLTADDEWDLLSKYDDRLVAGHWSENLEGVYKDEAGEEFLYVAQAISVPHQLDASRGWTLLWTEEPKTLLAVVYKSYMYHVAAALVGILLAVGLGIVAGRRFAEPIVATSAAAQKAAGGNFDIQLPDFGSDEVGDLGRAFNSMMENLKVSHQQVKRSLEERTESLLFAESTMAQLRSTYEAVGDGLLVVGRDGNIVQMNSAFLSMFDLPRDDYTEMDVAKLYLWLQKCAADKDAFDERWKHYESNPDSRGDELLVTSFPSEKQIEVFTAPVRNTVSPEPFARLWIFRDKTEFRGLEEQLRQSQKMDAVGQLAGGIAHDFNNLLTGISGNLALALCKIETGDIDGCKAHLHTAQGASERSAALVTQLLGYSRKSALELAICDVNDIVTETDCILVHTLDKKINVNLDLEDDLSRVEIDPNQMQQVVMNLCVNARDAIDGEGTITVSTQMQHLSAEQSDSIDPLDEHPSGDYVVISVTDTGSGMTAEQQTKMFEPFYTTKEQGKGTGLGLAMCYGIVKQHGGWIVCRSTIGQGTSFQIFLPKANKRVVALERDVIEAIQPLADPSQFTILLADDEPAVRMVAESLLKREGFNVHVVEDGLEAVRVSRELGDDLDLAILDLTMPKLSGGEAFAIMSEEFPRRPVLICSGYMLDLEGFGEEVGHTPSGFIQKPYKLETMTSEIARVLQNLRGGKGSKSEVILSS